MTHLVSFTFPGTGYTSRLYQCSLPGREILDKAIEKWNSVGGCQFPFQQGRGLERKITDQETQVIRILYASVVNGFPPPEPGDSDYEEFVANGNQWNDVVFRELANVGHRWNGEYIILTMFDLVKMVDPTFTFKRVENIEEVELF